MSWNSGFNNPLITWVANGAYSSLSLKPNRVGGKIFYIDSTSTGATYTFYDSSMNILSNVQVGDTPYYYIKTGTSTKDKYYIYNSELPYYSGLYWTYDSSTYETIGTTDTIGSGKTNTNKVLTDHSTYVTHSNTLWYKVNWVREQKVNGCSDWYVGSTKEYDELKNLDSSLFTRFIWSSVEDSSDPSNSALFWTNNSSAWISSNKYDGKTLLYIRSF